MPSGISQKGRRAPGRTAGLLLLGRTAAAWLRDAAGRAYIRCLWATDLLASYTPFTRSTLPASGVVCRAAGRLWLPVTALFVQLMRTRRLSWPPRGASAACSTRRSRCSARRRSCLPREVSQRAYSFSGSAPRTADPPAYTKPPPYSSCTSRTASPIFCSLSRLLPPASMGRACRLRSAYLCDGLTCLLSPLARVTQRHLFWPDRCSSASNQGLWIWNARSGAPQVLAASSVNHAGLPLFGHRRAAIAVSGGCRPGVVREHQRCSGCCNGPARPSYFAYSPESR